MMQCEIQSNEKKCIWYSQTKYSWGNGYTIKFTQKIQHQEVEIPGTVGLNMLGVSSSHSFFGGVFLLFQLCYLV